MTHKITYRVQRWGREDDTWSWFGASEHTTPNGAVEEMNRMETLFPRDMFRVVERHVQEVIYRVQTTDR